MNNGTIVSIHLAPAHGAPTIPVPEAVAVPGRGLEGDRHFRSAKAAAAGKTDVTLIEIESAEAIRREWDLDVAAGDLRRNLVTRGVALNALVGRTFRVGEVTLEGLMPCDPCVHLAGLTQADVLPALKGRGGLRARVVTGGVIRVGDRVVVDQAPVGI